MSNLRERIDALRGTESLTDFCKRVGVSRGTVYAAMKREEEKGDHSLDHKTAKLLVAGTKHSVAWILGAEDATGAGREYPVPAFPVQRVGDAKPRAYSGGGGSDPTDEDAMRWRALCELRDDGEDMTAAVEALETAEFDRSQKAPTWGDYYHVAKRHLKDGRAAGNLEISAGSGGAGSGDLVIGAGSPKRRAKRP